MKKNVLFFLPVFIPGGAGNAIYRMCKKFDKSKYNFYIISIGPCSYKKELKKYVRKFYELKASRAIFAIFELRSIINKLNFQNNNIFVSNINYANIITILALRKYSNLKIILVERTAIKELDIYFGLKDFIKKKIIKFLIKFLYKKADVIVTNSKKSSSNLRTLCKSNVKTIYSPAFKKFNKRIKKKKTIRKILSVGRLSKEKGYETLIRSVNLIKDKTFILKIIGDGDQKSNLKNLIKQFKLESKILLIGYQKNPSKYFKEADLYINCSFFEGFPNSVVEAISYNLPVICSRSHGGVTEMFSNGRGGYFFEAGNYLSLANLMNNFLNSQNNFQKKTNYKLNKITKFNTVNCVNEYQKIFESL